MNRKQLLIIVVVGLALGGFGLYLNKQKSSSFQRTAKGAGDRLLGDFPVNDVTHIAVCHNTNEVNLIKTAGWAVKERDNYPANTGEIIELVRKLWDLRAGQSQKIGESQLGRMELLPPNKGSTNSATLIELKGKDGKVIRSLLLGKQSIRAGGDEAMGGGGWPNGRWVYLPDKPGTTYLVSEAFSDVDPKPEHWLNKDFFKVEKPRSMTVTFAEATNSWKLTRETESDEWKLADAKPGEELDSSKVSSVSYALSSPNFEDVVAGGLEGETNSVVVEIETFDGFTYAVKVGNQTDDKRPLTVAVAATLNTERKPGENEKPEDKAKLDKEFTDAQKKLEEKLKKEKALSKSTYLVSNWTVESLLKERSQLLAAKEEPKKEEAEAGSGNEVKPADQPAGTSDQ